MASTSSKIYYRGSIFWLIFWLIVFFPVAVILLVLNATFDLNEKSHYIEYDGSLFWLFFWTILFFPIALVLLIVNGISFNIQDKS
jgi:hypothetical protein